jgi:hypothetical protein
MGDGGKRVGGRVAFRRCADMGMTRKEAAKHLGVSYPWLCRASKDIEFRCGRKAYAAEHREKLLDALSKTPSWGNRHD